jgi:hypothetical protein
MDPVRLLRSIVILAALAVALVGHARRSGGKGDVRLAGWVYPRGS